MSLVRSTSVASVNLLYSKIVTPLDDDTILIEAGNELFHVSRETGEILNRRCAHIETHEMLTLWDQESVVICNYCNYHNYHVTFFLWNFRRGEKSTPVKHMVNRIRFITPLGCGEEKYLAVGFGEVHIMRVPSFEVIHILSVPSVSVGSVRWILPLLDGNSFMCRYKSGQLIRCYISSTGDDHKALRCSKHQVFEGFDGPVAKVLQMRHDPRKLIVWCRESRQVSDVSYSIWDIETATLIHKLHYIKRWTKLFELGDSRLLVEFSRYILRVRDLQADGELLFEKKCTFQSSMHLRNGNILNLCTYEGNTYLEEYQVVR